MLKVLVDTDFMASEFLKNRMRIRVIAPLASRIEVKEDASISSFPKAIRHRIELAAKASMARTVRDIIRNIVFRLTATRIC